MRQAQRGASQATDWTKHGEAICTDDPHLPLTIWFRAIWQVTSQKNGISARLWLIASPVEVR